MTFDSKKFLPLPDDRMTALLKENMPFALGQIASGKNIYSVVDGKRVIFTPTPAQIELAKAVPVRENPVKTKRAACFGLANNTRVSTGAANNLPGKRIIR